MADSKKDSKIPPAVTITKLGAPKAPAAPAAPTVPVAGKKEELVQLEYSGDNHHLLDHVTAIRKGLNHVPKRVWDGLAGHEPTLALVKAGKIKLVRPAFAAPGPKSAPVVTKPARAAFVAAKAPAPIDKKAAAAAAKKAAAAAAAAKAT